MTIAQDISVGLGKYTPQPDHEGCNNESASPYLESEGLLSSSTSIRRRALPRSLIMPWPAILIFASLCALLGALTSGIIFLAHGSCQSSATSLVETTPEVMIKPCGSTPAEARARGCHFDVISFCWLPDECDDREMSEEFDMVNQLEWFSDRERTQPVSHEQIMTGEYTGLYVNWEYHLRHCTAMWKKMHRAIAGSLGKAAIDSYIGVYSHTEHCEHMLLGNRTILDVINTIILVKYPDCGIS